MSIVENITSIQQSLQPAGCQLIAVSKTKPVSMLMEAYAAGIRDFGENKVQEMTEKYEKMPKDVRWHMIGHLQRNKVKYIIPFVHLIHAVDSFRLLEEIEKQSAKIKRETACLLQVHIAEEETKFGFSEEELHDILHGTGIQHFRHVRIKGLMGMATFTEDTAQIKKEFKRLKYIFDRLQKDTALPAFVQMQELSMGMSGDYLLALEEGSSMARIGTTIFGDRK